MNKELAARIAQRQREAEDKQILYKAYLVATMLGKHVQWNTDSYLSTTHYDEYKLEYLNFKVICNESRGTGSDGGWGGSSTDIFWDDKLVFEDKDSYIPGEWEEKLEHYFELAKAKKASQIRAKEYQKLEEESRKEAELKAKYGL